MAGGVRKFRPAKAQAVTAVISIFSALRPVCKEDEHCRLETLAFFSPVPFLSPSGTDHYPVRWFSFLSVHLCSSYLSGCVHDRWCHTQRITVHTALSVLPCPTPHLAGALTPIPWMRRLRPGGAGGLGGCLQVAGGARSRASCLCGWLFVFTCCSRHIGVQRLTAIW